MSPTLTLLVWAWLMASSFVVSEHMLAYASPIATTMIRFLFALLVILPVLLLSWHQKGLDKLLQFKAIFSSRKRVLHYLVISGTLVGFFLGLFVSLQSTTALNTSVLYTLVPLIGVGISRVWLKEATPFLKIIGFMLGSIGAVIVLFSTQNVGSLQWRSGDYLFLTACVLLALHVVSVQKWGRSIGAMSGAFIILLFGSLWLIPIALLWGDLRGVKWLSQGFITNVLYLAVFTTLCTFLLQQRLVMTVGASRLLAFSYTIPVWVALFIASTESRIAGLLDWHFLLGVVIIIIALCLISGNMIRVKWSN